MARLILFIYHLCASYFIWEKNRLVIPATRDTLLELVFGYISWLDSYMSIEAKIEALITNPGIVLDFRSFRSCSR